MPTMLPEAAAESLTLAEADLECAQAALAGVWSHMRAAGMGEEVRGVPAILSQLRAIRRVLETEKVARGDVGEPPADWWLRD